MKSDEQSVEPACATLPQRILNAWDHFVELTKHQSRFFFHDVAEHADDSPRKILLTAVVAFHKTQMFKRFSVGDRLYRARHYDGSWPINDPKEFLAPPREKVRAGRMNPAGVQYLYLAEEPETAVLEVRPTPGAAVVVAEFELLKDLRILDLTDLEGLDHSQPDDENDHWWSKENLRPFLTEFVSAISLPVIQDAKEHISYIPSQIVCEYCAQAHTFVAFKKYPATSLDRIHGIRYRSTLHGNGTNVVLFPGLPSYFPGEPSKNEDGFQDWVARTEEPLTFHSFASWADVGRLILAGSEQ